MSKMSNEEWDILSEAARAIEPMWPITSLPEPVLKLFQLFHANKHDLQVAQVEVARLTADNLRLKSAIIEHRSQKADDRCIEDDDRLYEAVGDGIKCDRRVGSKDEMLLNCSRFIQRRCEQGHWPTYAALEAELAQLKENVNGRKT
jgi:hypothetical protein